VGTAALLLNKTGSNNTAIGTNALVNNDGGTFNVAIGDDALDNNVCGFHNIAVGGDAAFNIIAGSNNIYIDYGVSANGFVDESDTIRMNDSAPPAGGTSSQVFSRASTGRPLARSIHRYWLTQTASLVPRSRRPGLKRTSSAWVRLVKRSFRLDQ
jgi:hypothetical protein